MTSDNPIRFRLVGAVILIVLAVIFLPWLFDGAGYEYMSGIDDPVPPAPTFAEPDIALPSERPSPRRDAGPAAPAPERDAPVAELRSLENGEGVAAAGAEPERTEPPVRAVERDEPVQAGWAIQVGSFRDEDNARDQSARLRDAGWPAFIDDSTADGRPIYRVKVGPLAQREEAVKLGERLQDELELSGIVVAHP
ncbi:MULTISPECIES: SPOR domain-containing protein [unclassified Thioalkalivibrio]|uniref:SPOR domain-containing protein n=1 Tax=unclassified Thioalkalivibrio TaxID=2621013 RepID=UPI00035F7576|nr:MULTISPECIES: SPOR domain-containing protein [unclassified Thioalkalivibrio]